MISKSLRSLKLFNVRCLVGFDSSDVLREHHDCQVLIEGGKISKIGQDLAEADLELDTEHGLVTPGFVDPHTHIFPPNDRSNEFAMRVNKSYQEIAAAGGGILSSVRAARESSFEEIYERNRRSVERFVRQGTTTVEIKSGYGLTTESEIKQLQVLNKLREEFKDVIEIVPTFLGAHAFPPEFKD